MRKTRRTRIKKMCLQGTGASGPGARLSRGWFKGAQFPTLHLAQSCIWPMVECCRCHGSTFRAFVA